jgi:Protein of unknown function (DUF3159)
MTKTSTTSADTVVRDSTRQQPDIGHRAVELLLAAAPTVAFLVADAVAGSLAPALITAGVVAVAAAGWRLYRRERLRKALPGVLVVAVCAAVAAVTGQARGFFLVPTLVPFAVIAVCLGTLAAGRPLTGILLNRVAGGPSDWRRVPRLRRVHVLATLACVAVNVVNACVQVVFYRADDTLVLGAAHIATGPVFAAIVAVTVVGARRVAAAERTASARAPRVQDDDLRS